MDHGLSEELYVLYMFVGLPVITRVDCFDCCIDNAIHNIQDFIYPEGVALPVGGSDNHSVVLLEVHYDNPDMRTGTLCSKVNCS